MKTTINVATATGLLIILCISVSLSSAQADDGPEQTATPTRCPGSVRALVISGGGIRGAYQIGALWFLTHVLDCEFVYFAGTSTGAVSAAVLSQAANQQELKAQVAKLVTVYKSLDGQADLVSPVFLGKLRLIVPPRANGIYTLTPLERKLREQLDPAKVKRERLGIPVVSLQTGSIDNRFEFDSIFDQVIGSASIPLAVEPREARLWMWARPGKLENGVLVVTTHGAPGLPDNDCIVATENLRLRCEQVDAHRARSEDDAGTDENEGDWTVTLRLISASREDLNAFTEEVVSRRLSVVKFSVLHQLVDGGVTDNVPWWQVLLSPRGGFDILIILTAGDVVHSDVSSTKVHGGFNVAARAFELLWGKYQKIGSDLFRVFPDLVQVLNEARVWIQEVQKWRTELERKIGPSEMRRIDASMTAQFPEGEPDLGDLAYFPQLLFIEPSRRFFKETFDVNPEAIRLALEHGCEEAARAVAYYYREGTKLPTVDVPRRTVVTAEEVSACRQLRQTQ